MKLRTILMCIMLSLLSVPAFAVGTVTGTVTDASSLPLQGISVQFYNPTTGNTVTKAGITDASGNYSVAGLNAGSYKVIFFGNNGASAPFAQKWYNGAASFAAATPVTVSNGATTSGVNAVMGALAQPKLDLGSFNNAVAGTVVKIPVTLTTGGAAISSPGLTITYDPAKIVNVTSYDPADPAQLPALGAAATAAGKTISDSIPAAGTYTVGLLSTSNSNVFGDGVVVNLFFEIAAGASGPIALTNTASAADPSGAAVAVTGNSGTITLVDHTAPVVAAFTLPAGSTSLTVPVASFSATDNQAVAGYLVTESSSAPLASAAGWSASAPASYTVTAAVTAGVATNTALFAWAKDAAGNVSLSKSASVVITLVYIDLIKPTVNVFTAPADSSSRTIAITSLTASDDVAVTGYLVTESATAPAASDAGWSSSAPTSYSIAGSIPQGAATSKTLYAWAKDAAGNVSLSRSAGVTVTIAGPTLTFSAATLADGTSTKNPALNLSGSVNGNGSELQSLTLTQNALAPVAVSFDATSGTFNTAVVLTGGANTLTTVVRDAEGKSTTDSRVVTLDPTLADLKVTAPADASFLKDSFVTVTGSVGAPQSTSVTLSLNGGAAGSVALNGDNFSTTVNLISGANTMVITATDSVTGVHTATLSVISDVTAPALTVSAPAVAFATAKSGVTLTGSVTDAVTTPLISVTVNGVALASQPVLAADGSFSAGIPLPAVGSYAIVVSATDQSGNSSTVQRNVIRTYPSGNAADGVSAPTLADALKVLNFALGFTVPSADELINLDVAPLVDGKPAPNGAVNSGDALVVLEKIVGTVAW